MKNKTVSMILIIMVVVTLLSGIPVFSENSFERLWQEKLAYEQETGLISTSGESVIYMCYGDDYGEGGDNYNEYGWAFLLYTDKGKKLTYKLSASEGRPIFPTPLLYDDYDTFLACVELGEMCRNNQTPENIVEPWFVKKSDYRYVVQSLGIAVDELREAYRRMKEEPETARELLLFLSDEQFEIFLRKVEELTVPENFMIEAACMENDEQAEMLLAVPGNVYIKELGYTVSVQRIMSHTMRSESFAEYDMTTESFAHFMDALHTLVADEWWGIDGDKYEFLVEEQARQLAAAKTGDGAVTALWAVAVAIPALAVLVTVKRKRRI